MPDNATNEQIAAYLQLFNDDPEAAMRAIRSYTQTAHKKPAPIQPAGPLLMTVTNLAKDYKVGRQKVQALSNVSFSVHEGEFVAIVGSSGSGKSTLLQMLGGLDKPTSGSVIIQGKKLSDMSDRKLSRFRGQTVGFVFQFFYLQPFLRLGRNLEVPGMFARAKTKERQARVLALAEKVGLSDRLSHLPKELSGGQIQRAAVARALMNQPKVILADEPTGNLDSKNSAAIVDLFEQIRKDFGTTIIIATHDYAIAKRADRILTIQDGAFV